MSAKLFAHNVFCRAFCQGCSVIVFLWVALRACVCVFLRNFQSRGMFLSYWGNQEGSCDLLLAPKALGVRILLNEPVADASKLLPIE